MGGSLGPKLIDERYMSLESDSMDKLQGSTERGVEDGHRHLFASSFHPQPQHELISLYPNPHFCSMERNGAFRHNGRRTHNRQRKCSMNKFSERSNIFRTHVIIPVFCSELLISIGA